MRSLYMGALLRGVLEKLYICDVGEGREATFSPIGDKVVKILGFTGNTAYNDTLLGILREALAECDPVQTARILEFAARHSGKIAWVDIFDPIPDTPPAISEFRVPNYPIMPLSITPAERAQIKDRMTRDRAMLAELNNKFPL